jgi:hypothetical protein
MGHDLMLKNMLTSALWHLHKHPLFKYAFLDTLDHLNADLAEMLHALQVFKSIPGLFEAENPPINHWLDVTSFNCTIHILELHARAHICDTRGAELEEHVYKNWLLFRVSTSS